MEQYNLITLNQEETALVLTVTEYCMLQCEDQGYDEEGGFTQRDYIDMAVLRGRILGLSAAEVAEDTRGA